MRKHNYLATIQDDTWEDCKRIKELDGRSFNSLINEGLRLVRDAKMQELAQRRKTRTFLQMRLVGNMWNLNRRMWNSYMQKMNQMNLFSFYENELTCIQPEVS